METYRRFPPKYRGYWNDKLRCYFGLPYLLIALIRRSLGWGLLHAVILLITIILGEIIMSFSTSICYQLRF